MGRKITILGMGPSANERRWDIERYCEGTEIWGLNNGYIVFPHLHGKWARFFELHTWEYLKTWNAGVSDHFAALDRLECPVYVTQPLPRVRDQRRYDLVEVGDHFSSNYFLGSPSLMLMLALYEHDHGGVIDEIRSWGIDTSDPQHGQQRQSWAWWLRAAFERGIELSGSAIDFMGERERDEGLVGLRERVGDEIMRRRKQKQKE